MRQPVETTVKYSRRAGLIAAVSAVALVSGSMAAAAQPVSTELSPSSGTAAGPSPAASAEVLDPSTVTPTAESSPAAELTAGPSVPSTPNEAGAAAETDQLSRSQADDRRSVKQLDTAMGVVQAGSVPVRRARVKILRLNGKPVRLVRTKATKLRTNANGVFLVGSRTQLPSRFVVRATGGTISGKKSKRVFFALGRRSMPMEHVNGLTTVTAKYGMLKRGANYGRAVARANKFFGIPKTADMLMHGQFGSAVTSEFDSLRFHKQANSVGFNKYTDRLSKQMRSPKATYTATGKRAQRPSPRFLASLASAVAWPAVQYGLEYAAQMVSENQGICDGDGSTLIKAAVGCDRTASVTREMFQKIKQGFLALASSLNDVEALAETNATRISYNASKLGDLLDELSTASAAMEVLSGLSSDQYNDPVAGSIKTSSSNDEVCEELYSTDIISGSTQSPYGACSEVGSLASAFATSATGYAYTTFKYIAGYNLTSSSDLLIPNYQTSEASETYGWLTGQQMNEVIAQVMSWQSSVSVGWLYTLAFYNTKNQLTSSPVTCSALPESFDGSSLTIGTSTVCNMAESAVKQSAVYGYMNSHGPARDIPNGVLIDTNTDDDDDVFGRAYWSYAIDGIGATANFWEATQWPFYSHHTIGNLYGGKYRESVLENLAQRGTNGTEILPESDWLFVLTSNSQNDTLTSAVQKQASQTDVNSSLAAVGFQGPGKGMPPMAWSKLGSNFTSSTYDNDGKGWGGSAKNRTTPCAHELGVSNLGYAYPNRGKLYGCEGETSWSFYAQNYSDTTSATSYTSTSCGKTDGIPSCALLEGGRTYTSPGVYGLLMAKDKTKVDTLYYDDSSGSNVTSWKSADTLYAVSSVPFAATGGYSDLTSTSVKLSGLAAASLTDFTATGASVVFEYWPEGEASATTQSVTATVSTAASSTKPATYTATLSDLTTGKRYYYRLKSTRTDNSVSESGQIKFFRTHRQLCERVRANKVLPHHPAARSADRGKGRAVLGIEHRNRDLRCRRTAQHLRLVGIGPAVDLLVERRHPQSWGPRQHVPRGGLGRLVQ